MPRKSCFVIMPFRSHLDSVFAAVKRVAEWHGLDCARGDLARGGGLVLNDIIEHIRAADVVVADLTGRNSNVFYETGIAHTLKDPRQVILTAQRDGDVPFDLRALRYLKYSSDTSGLERFSGELTLFVEQALKHSPGEQFETIDGKMERTRRIVADYRAVLEAGDIAIKGLVIRNRAGLSSLAIDDRELQDARGPEERAYKKLLVEERDVLMALIRGGARLKVILTPPTAKLWDRTELEVRYDRLIQLLERDPLSRGFREFPHAACQVVLCPLLTNNLAILGERVIYEGTKGSLSGGFEITTRITHSGFIKSHVQAFDTLFKEAKGDTLQRYGPGLREAVVTGLKHCRKTYKDSASELKKWIADRAAR